MPTDNYDASLVMMRKRNAMVAAYKTNLTVAQNSNYGVVRQEQPTLQSAQVVAMRSGSNGCVCDTSTGGYTRRNPS